MYMLGPHVTRRGGEAKFVDQVAQIVREAGDLTGFDAGRWGTAFLDATSLALGGRQPRDFMGTSDDRRIRSTLVAQIQGGTSA